MDSWDKGEKSPGDAIDITLYLKDGDLCYSIVRSMAEEATEMQKEYGTYNGESPFTIEEDGRILLFSLELSREFLSVCDSFDVEIHKD